MVEQENGISNGSDILAGIPPEASKDMLSATEMLQILVDADICIPLFYKPLHPTEVRIKHIRDVPSDTDTYQQEQIARSPILAGYLMETSDPTQWIIIDTDWNSSVHRLSISRDPGPEFIHSTIDRLSNKDPYLFFDNHENIHRKDILPHELKKERLLPTQPENVQEINRILIDALTHNLQKAREVMKASRDNQAQTIQSFAENYRNLTNQDTPPA
jgi:hypothetical protein